MQKKWMIFIMDRSHGIDRPLIADGKFCLGYIDNKIYLEYIFSALNEIKKITGTIINIIVPYAHGLDLLQPKHSIRDFFFYYTTECNSNWYNSYKNIDIISTKKLEYIATNYNIETIKVNSEDDVYKWCIRNMSGEENVMLLNSGQVALNIKASCMMLSEFMSMNITTMVARGHSVGLTPCLLKYAEWMKLLSSWAPAKPCKIDANVVSVDSTLELLEQHGVSILFRSGHDLRTQLLIKLFNDISQKDIVDVAQCYLSLGDEWAFKASSGRTFTAILGDGIRFYGNGGAFVTASPDYHWQSFVQEQQLLEKYSGAAFADKEVLEVGCGDGVRSIMIKQSGAKSVVATDADIGIGMPALRSLLSQCGCDINGVSFVEAEGENLPFLDNSFDIVYSDQVLEHVREPFSCLKEMIRVLRIGGSLFMRYNPYFHLTGGHGECTTDVPWGHVIMTPEEFEEFISFTEFPERGTKARESLQTYFNPDRLTLGAFDKFIEQLTPIQVLYYHADLQSTHSEKITPQLLAMARENYPDITMRDLLTSQVTVVLKKVADGIKIS